MDREKLSKQMDREKSNILIILNWKSCTFEVKWPSDYLLNAYAIMKFICAIFITKAWWCKHYHVLNLLTSIAWTRWPCTWTIPHPYGKWRLRRFLPSVSVCGHFVSFMFCPAFGETWKRLGPEGLLLKPSPFFILK